MTRATIMTEPPTSLQPQPRPTWVRYRVVGWLTVAGILAYLTRNSFGVLESTIRTELGLSYRQSGWLQGTFFWTYALFQIPGGWLGHRWGTRGALAFMAFSWSAAAAMLGLAGAFWMLVAAQLLAGVAQAGLLPVSTRCISHWTPLNLRSQSCGTMAMGLQVGAIVAGALTGALLEARFSWRSIYLIYALPGIIWAAWFFIRFRNLPEQDPAVNTAELAIIRDGRAEPQTREETPAAPWRALLTSPVMGWLSGQQICRSAGYIFFVSWFPTFLQEARGVTKAESGYIQAAVLTGAMLGYLIGGVFADWVLRRTGSLRLSRQGVGAASQAICGLLILAAFFVEDVQLLVALLAIGSFFTAAGGTNALAVSIDIGGSFASHVYAIQNMAGCFAAAATPVVVGYLFQGSDDWDMVLVLFAFIYFGASVCWAMVNPTRRLSAENVDRAPAS